MIATPLGLCFRIGTARGFEGRLDQGEPFGCDEIGMLRDRSVRERVDMGIFVDEGSAHAGGIGAGGLHFISKSRVDTARQGFRQPKAYAAQSFSKSAGP